MRSKPFGRLSQYLGHAWIVRHDEGREQLRHVGNATPFIPRQQSDRKTLLVEDLTSGGKAQRDLTAFRLIKARKIAGIELDLPIA
jgi:hypothetical protein